MRAAFCKNAGRAPIFAFQPFSSRSKNLAPRRRRCVGAFKLQAKDEPKLLAPMRVFARSRGCHF